MELYFSPMACSLASRIVLYELALPASYHLVEPGTQQLADGSDYRAVHPLGLVPALRTDDGRLVTENLAVLLHLAASAPDGQLVPDEPAERTRLWQWLSFVATELHKGLFATLFDARAPEQAKRYALEKGASRLAHVDAHLTGRAHVLEQLSVADAYLFTVLNWTLATPVELSSYPALDAYRRRLLERPSFARAFAEELALYRARAPRAS